MVSRLAWATYVGKEKGEQHCSVGRALVQSPREALDSIPSTT